MRNEFNTRLLGQAKRHIGNENDDMMMPRRTQSTWTKVSQKITKRSLSLNPMPGLRLVEAGQAIEAFLEEIVDVPGSVSALDYAAAAKTAMEVWLSVGTDQSVLGAKPKQLSACQLCVDDDTMDDEAKRKLCQSHHLQRHQDSDVHSKFKQFSPRLALDNGFEGVVCELRAQILPNSTFLYQLMPRFQLWLVISEIHPNRSWLQPRLVATGGKMAALTPTL
ncbi:hypothetical protein DER45DRAFT_548241 [Fusarium avenaceum]|nr:hypothetical protein DER45DRAFT_548241 [Fusarium avenaceum]